MWLNSSGFAFSPLKIYQSEYRRKKNRIPAELFFRVSGNIVQHHMSHENVNKNKNVRTYLRITVLCYMRFIQTHYQFDQY